MSDRQLYVYVDLDGAPCWSAASGRACARAESATFEYDDTWLKHPQKFALEPALALGRGPQAYASGTRNIRGHGRLCPDRWGRVLIQREERRKARADGRAPHPLFGPTISWRLAISHDLGPCASPKRGALSREPSEHPPLMELKGVARRRHASMPMTTTMRIRSCARSGSSLGGAVPRHRSSIATIISQSQNFQRTMTRSRCHRGSDRAFSGRQGWHQNDRLAYGNGRRPQRTPCASL